MAGVVQARHFCLVELTVRKPALHPLYAAYAELYVPHLTREDGVRIRPFGHPHVLVPRFGMPFHNHCTVRYVPNARVCGKVMLSQLLLVLLLYATAEEARGSDGPAERL